MPAIKTKRLPDPQKKKRARKKPFVIGVDGKTANTRIREVMDLRSRELNRPYGEADLIKDCNIAAGIPSGAPERVGQQNINQLLNDDVDASRSSFLSVIAEAMMVRAVWLQFGWGRMRDDAALGKSVLDMVRQHT